MDQELSQFSLVFYSDNDKLLITRMPMIKIMIMLTHTRIPTTVVMRTMYPSRVRSASSSSVAKTWKKVSAEKEDEKNTKQVHHSSLRQILSQKDDQNI